MGGVSISRALAGALAALALSACGSDEPAATPVACLGSAESYLAALEEAPGEVRLEGETPISACLGEEQEPGALATVGESAVAAASELNRSVRREFDPRTALRLGYLVGAFEQGAETTGGIHRDLVLRLNAAARFSEGDEQLGAAFERAFGEGYAAGQVE
jgi:hypothetical protein